MKYNLTRYIQETIEALEYLEIYRESLDNPEHYSHSIHCLEEIGKISDSLSRMMRRKQNE